MLNLYAKAALYSPSKALLANSELFLPDAKSRRSITLDVININKYNKLVAWDKSAGSLLHPNYIQVLSLPMQLEMMIRPPFPFKAMGLVHIANSIQVNSLPVAYGDIDISTRFGNLYHHRRGIVFEVITEAVQEGEACVYAVSYYLARMGINALNEYAVTLPAFNESLLLSTIETTQETVPYNGISDINFSYDAGREYAKVSGDYNPIHLWPLTAAIFGFKRAIVHGMYSKALAFSKLYYLDRKTLSSGGFSLNTVFKAPISLPQNTSLQTNTKGGFCLSSVNKDKSRQHIVGEIVTNIS